MSHHHHHDHHHSHDTENVQPWGAYLLRVFISIFIVAILVAYGMMFQVNEKSETVVVTRFDNPIRVVSGMTEPGLHWKLPWPIDNVKYVDMRKRSFSTPHAAALTQDKQSIILLTYVVWQVSDAEQFLKSTRTVEEAENKLQSTVVSVKNTLLGTYNLDTLISTNPDHAQIMTKLENQICHAARAKHLDAGIEILQVGIKRISFPEDNISATLDKMRAERVAIATEIRARGETEANEIRNRAEQDAAVTRARGTQQAGTIIAEARKMAAEIYNQSHDLDPEFYEFWRQMDVIRKTIGQNTTLILQNERGVFAPIFEMPKRGALPSISPERPEETLVLPPEAQTRMKMEEPVRSENASAREEEPAEKETPAVSEEPAEKETPAVSGTSVARVSAAAT
ncbi:MAG: protease modulator HflC [Planctomycetia bacterium]|nr:protease modulator HflC [Planctomycetia bacterium]